MKTIEKKEKEFDTVRTFREIRDKISSDIQGMTFEQLQAYLNKTKLQTKKLTQKPASDAAHI